MDCLYVIAINVQTLKQYQSLKRILRYVGYLIGRQVKVSQRGQGLKHFIRKFRQFVLTEIEHLQVLHSVKVICVQTLDAVGKQVEVFSQRGDFIWNGSRTSLIAHCGVHWGAGAVLGADVGEADVRVKEEEEDGHQRSEKALHGAVTPCTTQMEMFASTARHLLQILPDLNPKTVHVASADAHTLVSVSPSKAVSEVLSPTLRGVFSHVRTR